MKGLQAPRAALDLGNSGTAIRLMTGLLAGQAFDAELTGDASLRQRPMERIAAPLRAMGAKIDTNGGKPPIRVRGGSALHGIEYTLPIASAQVKSALLIASLSASGKTTLRSPGPSRDHTERMFMSMGATVEEDATAHTVSVTGPIQLRGTAIDVPADFSSAAFFIVAACLGARSGLLIRNVGVNPTRIGLLAILRRMGAKIELRGERLIGAEPIADIFVRKSELTRDPGAGGARAARDRRVPGPVRRRRGGCGTTTVSGAEELRTKESDRLAVMATGLRALGAACA